MKPSLALTAAGLVFAASMAFAQPSQAPSGQAKQQTGPRPAPTNLQVLPRDISHERLITIMRHFTQALGVECSFCHVRGNFASDENPHKNVARGMIRMTMRINRELLPAAFGAPAPAHAEGQAGSHETQPQVSCYTCHRGSPEPVSELPAAPGAPPAHVAPDAPHQPH